MASSSNSFHKLFGIDAAHHGRSTTIEPRDDVNLQVIGLGLPRTGTTSLNAALEILGFGPGHQGIDSWRSPPRRAAFQALFQSLTNPNPPSPAEVAPRLRNLMRGYRSTTDNPLAYLVRECYAAYPDAKYIFTVRDSREQWWASYWGAVNLHFRRDWRRYVFRALIYSVDFIRKTDDFVQLLHKHQKQEEGMAGCPEAYDTHRALVERTVLKGKLLVYNVKEGWAPLCKFLDCDVPDQEFPRLNEAESMRVIYVGMQLYGAFMWCVYAMLAGGAGYVAFHPDVAIETARWCAGALSRAMSSLAGLF